MGTWWYIHGEKQNRPCLVKEMQSCLLAIFHVPFHTSASECTVWNEHRNGLSVENHSSKLLFGVNRGMAFLLKITLQSYCLEWTEQWPFCWKSHFIAAVSWKIFAYLSSACHHHGNLSDNDSNSFQWYSHTQHYCCSGGHQWHIHQHQLQSRSDQGSVGRLWQHNI